MNALLDRLSALPLVHGIRPGGINWGALTESTFAALVAHTSLLKVRQTTGLGCSAHTTPCLNGIRLQPHGLSFDVIGPMADPGVAAWVARLVKVAIYLGERERKYSVPGPATTFSLIPLCFQAVPAGTTFVVDHFASPPVLGNASQIASWQAAIDTLAAASPHVVLKAGGLLQYFQAGGALPSVAQLQPFASYGMKTFGWNRSLVEFNWFFCNWFSPKELANYAVWDAALISILEAWPQPLSQADVDNLFYMTAARAYRVHPVARAGAINSVSSFV